MNGIRTQKRITIENKITQNNINKQNLRIEPQSKIKSQSYRTKIHNKLNRKKKKSETHKLKIKPKIKIRIPKSKLQKLESKIKPKQINQKSERQNVNIVFIAKESKE